MNNSIHLVRRDCMQKIFFKKKVDLNHQLSELISISVDESIRYKMETDGMRAIGSIMINGEYKDSQKKHQFHETIDLDIFALFEKITDKRDFHVKVEDFDYHLIEGNLSLVIQAYVYGVLDDEDRVIDTVEQENQLDSAEEIEKLLREEEKIIDVVEQQDSSIDESAIPEKPEEVPVLNEDDQEDLGTYYFYVVQDGDSYETIAKHYQVDEYALKSYNHERSLTSGTIVIIPFVI